MDGKISEAFDLYKSGEKQAAAKLLAALVIEEPNNASAWFGLGVCLDDLQKKIYCFQKVLSIDPDNSQAKAWLEKLSLVAESNNCPHCGGSNPQGAKWCRDCGRDLQEDLVVKTESGNASVPESQPEEPRVETKDCPYCGEAMPETAKWCRNCGRDLRDYSTAETDSTGISLPEQQPAETGIHQQKYKSVSRKFPRIRVTSSIIAGVLIIGLIGVVVAIFYIFYQMKPIPLATPEPREFTLEPTRTTSPPVATPNPSSISPPYFEDFSNGPGIWHVSDDEEVSFTVSDERYVIRPKYPGGSWWTSPQAELSNIRLEFTTSFGYTYPMEDGGFRVNFRCEDIDEELCYIMTIAENGYLFVHRDAEVMVEHKLSPHINLYDHPNDWVILMDGQDFEIYCNGELLTTFSDGKYKSGDFGFGVFNSTDDKWGFNGVAFDDISVTPIN